MRYLKDGLRNIAKTVFSDQTLDLAVYDLERMRLRWRSRHMCDLIPETPLLHFGCGGVRVDGWLNVDLNGSDHDTDLSSGTLPWISNAFDCAVGNHVIEHLDLETEALPLLRELHRVIKPGGTLWLSCPDMHKLCVSYLADGMEGLVRDRIDRRGNSGIGRLPSRYLLNDMFHQRGRNRSPHKNLFDEELLSWTLKQTGFVDVRRESARQLSETYTGFPNRADDAQSLYLSAINTS